MGRAAIMSHGAATIIMGGVGRGAMGIVISPGTTGGCGGLPGMKGEDYGLPTSKTFTTAGRTAPGLRTMSVQTPVPGSATPAAVTRHFTEDSVARTGPERWFHPRTRSR